MNEHFQHNRRQFLLNSAVGLGGLALGGLSADAATGPTLGAHFAPTAKRVIFLFMAGGPSQHDLFDYKPKLKGLYGQDFRTIQDPGRLSGMTSGKKTLPVAPSMFEFAQHGKSGAWVSELLPHTAAVADDLCFIKTMTSKHVNHDPAITFLQSGHQFPGRPSTGAWCSYGLGSGNKNLPDYMVLLSQGNYGASQPLLSRLWGSGFLPSKYQGVKLRSASDPVLYLNDPSKRSLGDEQHVLNARNALDHHLYRFDKDPEIHTRIAQYEMAHRMQTSVPDLADTSDEPESTFELYGEDARKPGTFARNCLMARRMAEKGVRFTQLFHAGWDHHDDCAKHHPTLCRETDQACAGLVADLKQRGLLEDTLIVWGGEFGRTVFSQGGLKRNAYGRDHHPYCYTYWMAGGGVKAGYTHGETDDFSSRIVKDPVEVHDLHATMMHMLGFDHERLTYKYQGRYYRLTDIHGKVVHDVLA